MARLRNRIVKADFWGDGDLLRWHRDKRHTYQGLWSVAEDSACLEDDPFTWKLLLWASPIDTDITVELLEQWRDEMIAEKKLVEYFVDGRRYLFVEPFHRHEHPRNPQVNSVPLPPWVTFVQHEKDARKGLYNVDWVMLAAYLEDPKSIEQPSNKRRTKVVQPVVQGLTPARPALPGPALSCPDLSGTEEEPPPSDVAGAREAEPLDGGGGGDQAQEGTGGDDPLLWDLWELPAWKKDDQADRELLRVIAAESPRASMAAVFTDYRLAAVEETIARPRAYLRKIAARIHGEQPALRAAPDPVEDEPEETPEQAEARRQRNIEEVRKARAALATAVRMPGGAP